MGDGETCRANRGPRGTGRRPASRTRAVTCPRTRPSRRLVRVRVWGAPRGSPWRRGGGGRRGAHARRWRLVCASDAGTQQRGGGGRARRTHTAPNRTHTTRKLAADGDGHGRVAVRGPAGCGLGLGLVPRLARARRAAVWLSLSKCVARVRGEARTRADASGGRGRGCRGRDQREARAPAASDPGSGSQQAQLEFQPRLPGLPLRQARALARRMCPSTLPATARSVLRLRAPWYSMFSTQYSVLVPACGGRAA